MQRLTEANEPDVAVGQLGEDDAAIQFQVSLDTEHDEKRCVTPVITADQV